MNIGMSITKHFNCCKNRTMKKLIIYILVMTGLGAVMFFIETLSFFAVLIAYYIGLNYNRLMKL